MGGEDDADDDAEESQRRAEDLNDENLHKQRRVLRVAQRTAAAHYPNAHPAGERARAYASVSPHGRFLSSSGEQVCRTVASRNERKTTAIGWMLWILADASRLLPMGEWVADIRQGGETSVGMGTCRASPPEGCHRCDKSETRQVAVLRFIGFNTEPRES